jgi:protein O-mannosyl-transferase
LDIGTLPVASPSRTKTDRFYPLLLALITFAAFAPVLTCDFTNWDDTYTVTHNPGLNPVSMAAVKRFWTHADMDIYMPLTQTVWAVTGLLARLSQPDAAGATLNPLVFHGVNLLVHVASVLAVYSLLRLMIDDSLASALGAAVFAIHPVMVEPVAWVSGLKDVLCGALSLWALRIWLAPISKSDRPKWRLILTTIIYSLALLAKPSATILPLVAMILATLVFRWSFSRAIIRVLPWIALAIPIAIIGAHAQPATNIPSVPFLMRGRIVTDAVWFYWGKLIWPTRLGIDYGHTPAALLRENYAVGWMILLLLIAVFAALRTMRKKNPLPIAAACVFIAALIPVLGLIPFDFQQYSTVADHYLYVAMLGPAILIAVIAHQRAAVVNVGLTILIFALAYKTAAQTLVWRDSQSLMSHALVINPNSWMAHTNLGLALKDDDPREAVHQCTLAVQLQPRSADLWNNLGLAYQANRQNDSAVDAFRRGVQLEPNKSDYRMHLTRALDDTGQREQAIDAYRQLLAMDPNNAAAHADLAADLAESGQLSQAIEQYHQALRIDPTLPAAVEGLRMAQGQQRDIKPK